MINVWNWNAAVSSSNRNKREMTNSESGSSLSDPNKSPSKIDGYTSASVSNNNPHLCQLPGHNGNVLCMIMMDENILASGSSDSTIMLWDVNLMKSVATLFGHENWVQCLL